MRVYTKNHSSFQKKRAEYLFKKSKRRLLYLKSKNKQREMSKGIEITIIAPEIVELMPGNSNQILLLRFLENLRRETLRISKESGTIIVSFENTSKVSALGMITIYAELKRLAHYFGTVKFKVKEARPSGRDTRQIAGAKLIVNQVLDHLGILRSFGNNKKFNSVQRNVVNWEHHEGGPPIDMIPLIPMLDRLTKLITNQSSTSLEQGLPEILDNTADHAYSQIRDDGLNIDDAAHNRKRWYLFSNVGLNSVTVVVYDLGVGIPETLPHMNTGWQRVKERLQQRVTQQYRSDGNSIKYAFKHGRTRTELDHRGTGLPHLVQTIEKVPGASLTILSNRGAYNFVKGEWSVPLDSQLSLHGTLVAWRLPLTDTLRAPSGASSA